MKQREKIIDKKEACPVCLRPREHCFCGKVPVLKNALTILILQHPQERYKLLNSALLTHTMLHNSVLRIGLCWRNFRHALGEEADPQTWGVLFLKGKGDPDRMISFFDRKHRPLSSSPAFKGLVLIDGSWKQAKTLWWRNPWLLKLNRILLNPQRASIRPQVKKEGLSTIEAAAFALECLGEDSALCALLVKHYEDRIVAPGRQLG